MYGRGPASIADQIGASVQEANKIIQDFYNGFPKVKQWMDKTVEDCRRNGYVEDFWGRRRRLPDIQLPQFQITDLNESKNATDINPLLGSKGLVTKVENPKIAQYREELTSARGYNQVNAIKQRALADRIHIHDNGGFISQAERQSVNARVQGGAATMSKLAMIKVYRSSELRRLGFKMLLQVHDELIGECPEENVEAVSELLTSIMKDAAKPVVQIPFKCDADISKCWYYSDNKDMMREKFEDMINSGMLKQTAFSKLLEEYSEYGEDVLRDFLEGMI